MPPTLPDGVSYDENQIIKWYNNAVKNGFKVNI
jgi:hypothetical protein